MGDRLLNPHLWQPEREPIARGLAVGGFFSVLQFPFQSLPAVIVAMAVGGNIPAALVGCWITNPLSAAFIVWIELEIGFRFLGMGSPYAAMREGSVWEVLKDAPFPFAVGALLLAPVTAVMCYFGSKWIYDLVRILIERSAKNRRLAPRWRRKPPTD